jgi:anti-sigma-K factor RskA
MSEGPDMDDRDGLAAEYVLGSLPLPERLQAERLIASDPGFKALVAAWQNRLSDLDAHFAPADPPTGLMDRIEARLFPVPSRPASAPARWRLPLFAGLAAGLAALVLVLYQPGTLPEPTLTATLAGADQPLAVAAAWYAEEGELIFTRTAGPAAGADKDYELWIIREGKAAVSLGVLGQGETRVPVADLPPGTTLAITLEAKGGSPTGTAQGPLVAAAVIGG